MVHGKWSAYSCTAEEIGTGETIVAVCDSDVFHEIALMEDVTSGYGDGDVEEIGVCFCRIGKDVHFVEEGGELGGGEGEASTGVEVGDFSGHFTRFYVWTETRAAVVFRVDLNRFNTRLSDWRMEKRVRT